MFHRAEIDALEPTNNRINVMFISVYHENKKFQTAIASHWNEYRTFYSQFELGYLADSALRPKTCYIYYLCTLNAKQYKLLIAS